LLEPRKTSTNQDGANNISTSEISTLVAIIPSADNKPGMGWNAE
jgi:hypothetical protein